MKFSVLLSVYANEKIEYFKVALDSVLKQTLPPDEIVLVRDGPVPPELQQCIDDYLTNYTELFTYVPLEENLGLGVALNHGVKSARNEWIIRMDTDDLCVPERFALQMGYLNKHPEISVLGGQIREFIDTPERFVSKREVPTSHPEIATFMQVRNPFNHMTVAFRKSAVLAAGNYQDMHYVEDYFLWCRMLLAGHQFANLPDILVYARIGADMYRRRGGYKYFCSLKKLERFKLENHLISRLRYIKTVALRFVVQVLLPNRVRGAVMKTFVRKKQ